jgi:hypothetical protein
MHCDGLQILKLNNRLQGDSLRALGGQQLRFSSSGRPPDVAGRRDEPTLSRMRSIYKPALAEIKESILIGKLADIAYKCEDCHKQRTRKADKKITSNMRMKKCTIEFNLDFILSPQS